MLSESLCRPSWWARRASDLPPSPRDASEYSKADHMVPVKIPSVRWIDMPRSQLLVTCSPLLCWFKSVVVDLTYRYVHSMYKQRMRDTNTTPEPHLADIATTQASLTSYRQHRIQTTLILPYWRFPRTPRPFRGTFVVCYSILLRIYRLLRSLWCVYSSSARLTSILEFSANGNPNSNRIHTKVTGSVFIVYFVKLSNASRIVTMAHRIRVESANKSPLCAAPFPHRAVTMQKILIRAY